MELPRTRREQYADSTRLALLEAAKQAFTETGYQATGIDDITDIARVTKGALYHHFRDKRAIFDALIVELEDEAALFVEQRVRAEPERAKRFAVGVEAYLTACSEPSYRRLVIQDAPSALGMKRFREIDQDNAERLMVAPLLSMEKAGLIACPDVRFLAHILGGIVWEAALLLNDSKQKRLHKRLAVEMVCKLLDAYATKKSGRKLLTATAE